MRYLTLLFILAPSLLQGQGVADFDRIICEESIPSDFTTLTTHLFEDDYALNLNEELDKDFFLSTRFYTDQLLQSGKILFNDPLTNYVSKIGKHLLKDDLALYEQLRFYVIRSNAVNAFATDQGIIVFTTGLIAHAENEAQIAFILGHEISHFTEKHVRKTYVEYKDYAKSKGRYRRLSYYEAINKMSLYNKAQELEADEKGIAIYLNSTYASSEIENAFVALHYGYLPYEEKPFDPVFLETEQLNIPASYFPDTVKSIDQNLNFDDHGSTHPNMRKRIDAANPIVEKRSSEGNKKFEVVNESEFKTLQTLARFEGINIDLADRFYGDALFNIFVMSEEFPNNRFLDISKVKALYGLAKYKNHQRFDEATSRLEKVEGESYKLHYLLRILNRQQLNVITFRHLFDLQQKYPNDAEFKMYYADFLNEFALNSKIDFDKLKAIPLAASNDSLLNKPSFNLKDSIKTIELSAYSKVKKAQLKKDLYAYKKQFNNSNPETDFHLYGLHDLAEDRSFIPNLKSLNRTLVQERNQKDSTLAANKKRIKNHGYTLGIKEVMVVDPIYQDNRLNKDENYLKSEQRKIEIAETYTKEFKRLDIGTQIIDSKSLTTNDVTKYNDIALIKDWMSEILDHDGIDMISSSHFRMKEIQKKHKVSNFLFTGVYSFKDHKELTGMRFLLLGSIYLTPFVLIDWLMVHNQFQMVSFEINAETDEIEMLNVQDVNLNATPKMIRSYMYNILYQLNSEK
ncbi:MAG: M48 family metalloprotease [Crocinitomix sp.]|nr:M48 family metalloprotease [Crocinitomix sp.]